MSAAIVDADGKPLSSGHADPKDLRIAELERQLDEQRAANLRLQAKIASDEVDMLVSLAIEQRRMLVEVRPWAIALGRRDIEQLRQFIERSPALPGGAP